MLLLTRPFDSQHSSISFKKLYWLHLNWAHVPPEKFHSSHFPSSKLFLWMRKTIQWATTWVFISFSCIFGCWLTVFSVNLDAEHWNHTWESIVALQKFAVHAKKERQNAWCAAALLLCTKGLFLCSYVIKRSNSEKHGLPICVGDWTTWGGTKPQGVLLVTSISS